MIHRMASMACALFLLVSLRQGSVAAQGQHQPPSPNRVAQVAPQVLLVPTQGVSGLTVTVAAAGFAPLETVSLRFGLIDPFTGTIAHPVFSISGRTDRLGRLGDRWGAIPVPPQVLPAPLSAGLYTLQAVGATSVRTATTTLSLPFVATVAGMQCPIRPLASNHYGAAFVDAGAGFAPGQDVVATVNFPMPAETMAYVNRSGQFWVLFRVPEQTPAGVYSLVIAGLRAGTSHQEQLRTCMVMVAAS